MAGGGRGINSSYSTGRNFKLVYASNIHTGTLTHAHINGLAYAFMYRHTFYLHTRPAHSRTHTHTHTHTHTQHTTHMHACNKHTQVLVKIMKIHLHTFKSTHIQTRIIIIIFIDNFTVCKQISN